jgi:hypothetical protein
MNRVNDKQVVKNMQRNRDRENFENKKGIDRVRFGQQVAHGCRSDNVYRYYS